jgi:NNP family nitrate/nitrite transporter-like MFS transporter
MSTVAFTVCFASWVLNAVLITYLVGHGLYPFAETEVAWLLAVPILTGALARLPLGMLTDAYGGRRVFTLLMLLVAVPMYVLSLADGYATFLFASLGFGFAGGGFAVGVGYVSPWFDGARQGTALGIFGVGNAGAAITTVLAPRLLHWFTDGGRVPDGWRYLPRAYAAALVVMAVAFYLVTRERRPAGAGRLTLAAQLAPLRSIVVWRLGAYYALVFGAFVALAQWIIPYGVNVYQMPVATAGLLAAVFSLPSGVIRAAGGWLSDRFGARTVMYWVFGSSALACLVLSVPRMDIRSPGEGVSARKPGTVTAIAPDRISVGDRAYRVRPAPPAPLEGHAGFLPRVQSWQEPIVAVGEAVEDKQLLARGVTHIDYAANVWMFAGLVLVFGVSTGVGKAAVYKFIPEHFPGAVGVVGGTVGLIGALGGFVFPVVFGYLLRWTGLWTSCWVLLAIVSLGCLVWMHVVVRRIMREEVPELVRLIERRPAAPVPRGIAVAGGGGVMDVQALLRQVPFFTDLTADQLGQLARAGRQVAMEAEQIVFRDGDAGDGLYVMLAGQATVYRTPHGQRIELARLGAGDFFGELALIDGAPRSATVATLTPCQFFVVGRTDFLTTVARSTGMLANLLIGLSTKVRSTNEQLFELALKQERLRAQTEIDRHRAVAQMVAGVAHEINTPLGIVNQAASVITDSLAPGAVAALARDEPSRTLVGDLVEAASLIQANAARAAALIASFKNLSVRQVTDVKERLDLRALTGEVAGLYRLKARASRLTIEIKDELGSGAADWHGYPGYFSQIILNLLTNVDRYAYPEGEGGKVEIVLSRDEREPARPRFAVVVRDFGRGIPPENLPRVFEAFFTTGHDSGGTGLGLAIVHNLVTSAFGGEIGIESAPGVGTTVRMVFPQTVADA